MNNSRALKRAAEMLALAALMACGSGNEGDDTTPVATTPVTYVGNTNPAVVTPGNAGAITANVFSTGETSQGVSNTSNLAVPQLSGVLNIGRHMHRALRDTVARNRIFLVGGSPPITVNDRLLCHSGDVRVSGPVGDIGTMSDSDVTSQTVGALNALRRARASATSSDSMEVSRATTTAATWLAPPASVTLVTKAWATPGMARKLASTSDG